jgi:hypothetical protein
VRHYRVFLVTISGELQIIPVCAPQQTDAEIPAAAQIGGYFALAPVSVYYGL